MIFTTVAILSLVVGIAQPVTGKVTCNDCYIKSPTPPACAAMTCPSLCDVCFKPNPPEICSRVRLSCPGTTPCLCTKEYLPVCAIFPNGTLKTFANKCLAKCAKAFCWQPGTCKSWIKNPPVVKEPCAARICPELYLPVCGIPIGGKKTTFPNSCFAGYPCSFCYKPGACTPPVA